MKGVKDKRNSDSHFKSRIWNWFVNLTLEERVKCVSFEDKEWVQLIQRMYKRKVKEGEGLFFSVDDESNNCFRIESLAENLLNKRLGTRNNKRLKNKFKYIVNNNNEFCFKKLSSLSRDWNCSYPERLLPLDAELEKNVRLCDTKEYLDTITVATNLLKDAEHFLFLMEVASRGLFLGVPCRLQWDVNSKRWVWQSPAWFVGMGYYSLATFVAAKLEKVLWMRYWEYNQLDPRSSDSLASRPKFSFIPNNSQALLSKGHITQFWLKTSPLDRRKIVGGLGNIVEHVLMENSEGSNDYCDYVDCSSGRVDRGKGGSGNKTRKTATSNTNTKIRPAKEDYPRLLEALVDLSMEEKTLELLFKEKEDTQHNEMFIEILYFSPLSTIGSPLNMILRRLGICIQRAYTEKIGMDLILGEEAEKLKETKKKNKKKQKEKAVKERAKTKKKEKIAKKKPKEVEKLKKQPSEGIVEQPRVEEEIQEQEDVESTDLAFDAEESALTTQETDDDPSWQEFSRKKKRKKDKKKNPTPNSFPTFTSDDYSLSIPDKRPKNRPDRTNKQNRSKTNPRSESEKKGEIKHYRIGTESREIRETCASSVGRGPEIRRRSDSQRNNSCSPHPRPNSSNRKLSLPSNDHPNNTAVPNPPISKKNLSANSLHHVNDWKFLFEKDKPKLSQSQPSSQPLSPSQSRPSHSQSLPQYPSASPQRLSKTHPDFEGQISVNHPSSNAPRSLSLPLTVNTRSGTHEQKEIFVWKNHKIARASETKIQNNSGDVRGRTAWLEPSEPNSPIILTNPPYSVNSATSTTNNPHHSNVRNGQNCKNSDTSHVVNSDNVSSEIENANTRGRGRSPTHEINQVESPRSKRRSSSLPQRRTSKDNMHFMHRDSEDTIKLHREMEACIDYMQAIIKNRHEKYAEVVVRRVSEVVNEIWPEAKLEIYGSYGSGLCIPSSDLDLVVTGATFTDNESPIFKLATALYSRQWVKECQPISTAKVPVIKLLTYEELPTDITFSVDDNSNSLEHNQDVPPILRGVLDNRFVHTGLPACRIIKELKQQYAPLEPLVLILKQLLSERGLNNAYTGGLSSYCLVFLVSSFLQLRHTKPSPHHSSSHTHSQPQPQSQPHHSSHHYSSTDPPVDLTNRLHHGSYSQNTPVPTSISDPTVSPVLSRTESDEDPSSESPVSPTSPAIPSSPQDSLSPDSASSPDGSRNILKVVNFQSKSQICPECSESHYYRTSDPVTPYTCKYNLGVLLLDFLELYGKLFNPMQIGINEKGRYFFIGDTNEYGTAPLVILDPLNPRNNIGCSAFSMERVQHAFLAAYGALTSVPFSSIYSPPLLGRVLTMANAMVQNQVYHC
eukprot:TRINITY_DN2470_c0_g2_i1.p1 TRINITY_DN2470_c0_g2~~TRINITY_DN2470_c0_g2_i1.p1  ORF type:complete len:1346 (+),score=243.05 TRINITY_DN2470_c0_g2_i1:42-4079(+)